MSEEYVDLVRRVVPKPDQDQTRRFAKFILDDHSWYKKLPIFGAGEPFFLYLAPHNRQLFVQSRDAASAAWRDVVEDESTPAGVFRDFRIDYQPGDIEQEFPIPLRMMVKGTTASFRERLGCWSYWNYAVKGTIDTQIDNARRNLTVAGDNGSPVSLPGEVLEAGLVYLNALVHPDFDGSRQGYEYELLRSADSDLPAANDEHGRQLGEILAALDRVTALVWADR